MNKQYFELIFYRAALGLKSEASKNYLGILWWLIEPLLYLGVFYFVFEFGLRQGGEGFVNFLLCGLVVWKWFDGSIKACTVAITQNVGIMYQIYLPKYIFPVTSLLTSLFKFLIILFIFLVFLVFNGAEVSSAWVWLLPLFFVQMLFILAAGLLIAALVPVIPDLRLVVNYVMLMLFFSSGIFFDVSDMSPDVQYLLSFNPFMVIIDAYRGVLLLGEPPKFIPMLAITVGSFVLMVVNKYIYAHFDRIFPRLVN